MTYGINHRLEIHQPVSQVFDAISTAEGLSRWWTKTALGSATVGGRIELDFGPEFQWSAEVMDVVPNRVLRLRFDEASEDWVGTELILETTDLTTRGTTLTLRHEGWLSRSHHFGETSYCWALYLRLLKRWLEGGEFVEYERRGAA